MKSIIKGMFGTLCPWGKFWLYLGLASLAAAAGMSAAVGWKMTALHAVFLACLSFVTAFLPEVAYRSWGEGRKGVALGLSVLAIPLFMVEFGQHAAYTAGIRGHDLATARVQNVRYDGAQESVKEDKARHEWAKKRLAELTAQNGWSATLTADAERAKLPGLELAIAQEASRGGCKSKCLERTKERDLLQARIAILEEKSILQKQIDGTKDLLNTARAKAETVEHKSSQTEHMNAFLSKAVSIFGYGDLSPTPMVEEVTQQSANLAMAMAGTGLPALALFIAGLYRREGDGEPIEPVHTAPAAPPSPAGVVSPRVSYEHMVGVGRPVFQRLPA